MADTDYIFLSQDLGLSIEYQLEVDPNKTAGFAIFDFDDTLHPSAQPYADALYDLVNSYTDPPLDLPTAYDIETGHYSFSAESFYSFGVPRSLHEDQLWPLFGGYVKRAKLRAPVRGLYKGVPKMLKEASKKHQVVVVTLNSIQHDISDVILEHSGVEVNVLVANGCKTGAIEALAKHHNSRKGTRPPFYFGNTPSDMRAAANSVSPVIPIGVHRPHTTQRGKSRDRQFLQEMRRAGAVEVIRHGQMADVLFGRRRVGIE